MKNSSNTFGIIVDKISADIIGILYDLILLSGGPISVTYEINSANPFESNIAKNAGCKDLNQSTETSSCKASYKEICLVSSLF